MVSLVTLLSRLPETPKTREETVQALEYLFARLTVVTVGRPLFGVLATGDGHPEWLAGGTGMADLLGRAVGVREVPESLPALFGRLGIDAALAGEVLEAMGRLSPGERTAAPIRLPGQAGRMFSIVFRRRKAEDGALLQFTITDITDFARAERATRDMAASVLAGLGEPMDGGLSARDHLKDLQADFVRLGEIESDARIAGTAERMAACVEALAGRAVEILRRFEDSHESPSSGSEDTGAVDWRDVTARAGRLADGIESVSDGEVRDLLHAGSFVANAIPIMVLGTGNGILALNGARDSERFDSAEALVRGLGVEENSRHTAGAFFDGLSDASAEAIFSMEDRNMEAWGRPLGGGAWQAVLTPAATAAADVRGLFHGFKNLLLQLQVLHVVRTRSDVEQISNGIDETLAALAHRLEALASVAETGRLDREPENETVAEWVRGAWRAARAAGGTLSVDLEDSLADLALPVIPGEMEDVLAELAANAFHHGATTVHITGRRWDGRLELRLRDNGRGMDPATLDRLRRVIRTRTHDPALSTREGGTGNGLLGAAKAIDHLVDGRLEVGPNPVGQGVEVIVSLKVPASGTS